MFTWKYMPEAWSASEENRVLRLPSMAWAGASPAPGLVFELAVQPVSGSWVSVAAAAAEVKACTATGARPSAVTSASAAQLASRPLRLRRCHPVCFWNNLPTS